MLEEMIFLSQEEKADFEKYRQLKGDDLYYQIYRILAARTSKVRYATVRAYIRYDKNLRDTLYIYLATLEEFCKARLLDLCDISVSRKYQGHCYKELAKDLISKSSGSESKLYYGFQPDFGDLMHICSEKGVLEISDDDQKSIKHLRNKTMHHALILFGNARTEKELFNHFSTLEKSLNAFASALPQDYHTGFLSEISRLNDNTVHNTRHLKYFCLEVQDGRICIKK